MIIPYSADELSKAGPIDAPILQQFNHVHSGDRMCSEHGVGFLKNWGIVRGRNDIILFEDQDLFYSSVKVCWALHNYTAILKYENNNH